MKEKREGRERKNNQDKTKKPLDLLFVELAGFFSDVVVSGPWCGPWAFWEVLWCRPM